MSADAPMFQNERNTYKVLGLTTVLNLDDWLAALVDNLEGEVLDIGLDFSVVELASNETLGIEDTARET